jgi:hypothetical protein
MADVAGELMSARVMVNRIWQYHSGRGIVRSPNTLGLQATPTHGAAGPAGGRVRRPRGIKAMHRLIMTSNAYRMASSGGDPKRGGRSVTTLWRSTCDA